MRAVDSDTLRHLKAVVLGALGPDGVGITSQIEEMVKRQGEYPSLLSTHGRLILLLLENPGASVPDLALWLGVSETHTSRLTHDLTTKQVITRTKLGRKYGYRVNLKRMLNQPDIIRLVEALDRLTATLDDGRVGEK